MMTSALTRLAFALAALAIGTVATADTIRLSEPVESDAASETFGQPIDPTLPRMNLADLVADATVNLGRSVLVDTRIARVCQKKGCFFMAQEGAVTLRVSFRDYGFFIPTDASGKRVTLAGELVEREVSPEQAAHFAADLGQGAAGLEPGTVYEVVADAVRIPRGEHFDP